MTTFSLRLPEAIRAEAQRWAERDGLSLNGWIAAAVDRGTVRRRLEAHNQWVKDNPLYARWATGRQGRTRSTRHCMTEMQVMAPRRGEVWTVDRLAAGEVLVVSGNLNNNLPDHPFALAMEVVRDVSTEIVQRIATGLKLPDCCVLLAAEDTRATVILTVDDRLAKQARERGYELSPVAPEEPNDAGSG